MALLRRLRDEVAEQQQRLADSCRRLLEECDRQMEAMGARPTADASAQTEDPAAPGDKGPLITMMECGAAAAAPAELHALPLVALPAPPPRGGGEDEQEPNRARNCIFQKRPGMARRNLVLESVDSWQRPRSPPVSPGAAEILSVERAASCPTPAMPEDSQSLRSPRSCIASPRRREFEPLTSPRKRRLYQIERLRNRGGWEGKVQFVGSADIYERGVMAAAFIVMTQKMLYRANGLAAVVAEFDPSDMVVDFYADTGFVDIILPKSTLLCFFHSETKSASALRFLDVVRDYLPDVVVTRRQSMSSRLDSTIIQYLARQQAIRRECEGEVRKAVVNEAANEEYIERDKAGTPAEPDDAGSDCGMPRTGTGDAAPPDAGSGTRGPSASPSHSAASAPRPEDGGAPARQQRWRNGDIEVLLERERSDDTVRSQDAPGVGTPSMGSSTCSPVLSPRSDALHAVRAYAMQRRRDSARSLDSARRASLNGGEHTGSGRRREPPDRCQGISPRLRGVFLSDEEASPPAAVQLKQRSDSAPPARPSASPEEGW
eukprot:TRINITY_DN6856_c0_g2_i1.p1 TRINITY_DN6856_c0_g2~~TRINITY_DN6856_c0_g2_i1.p1  ORF type:complete len:604 (+),score=179.45 TRINITY_DN6856_c0_g2_i1:176-1813(+)